MENTAQQQSRELATQLWTIANELRGSMDASKFKNYILGLIFYRYLSERTEKYMDELLKDDGLTYTEALKHEDYAPVVWGWSIGYLGYIIKPEHLWRSLIEKINNRQFSVVTLETAIADFARSTIRQESEPAFEGLFDDMNMQDVDLGKNDEERSSLIASVMLAVNDISFDVGNAEMDVLGTAYMMLVSLFASDAGKKGGEFFTPACASKLVARLATVGMTEARNVADSCAGSGSLLLEVQKHLTDGKVGHYYATEKNKSSYNLLRRNLLMQGISYRDFSCYNADSIKEDNYYDENGNPILFDVQVENPPYSARFDQSPELLKDPRFSGCGVMAPQGKADLMFVESMVHHMSENGRIAVVLPSGALFRGRQRLNGKGDAEYEIRKYLIETLNVVDAIIGLPEQIFYGTALPAVVMILRKNRSENADNIFFVDASQCFIPQKATNVIPDEEIDRIVNAYVQRETVGRFSYVAPLDEVRKNGYNCNISRYVNRFEKEPAIDLGEQTRIIHSCDEKLASIEPELKNLFRELGLEV